MKEFTFEGKRVSLRETEDREEDNIKIWHALVCTETGREIHSIDWTPYGHMSEEDVELYLLLRTPSRREIPSIGPLSREGLEKILRARYANMEGIMEEFVADVECAGPGAVEEDWPDLAATFKKAKRTLKQN